MNNEDLDALRRRHDELMNTYQKVAAQMRDLLRRIPADAQRADIGHELGQWNDLKAEKDGAMDAMRAIESQISVLLIGGWKQTVVDAQREDT